MLSKGFFVKRLLFIFVVFLGMNSHGMEHTIKAIGARVVSTCYDFGRDVMQEPYNKKLLGLVPAAYLGLEMAGFFHMNKGKGAYDPEGFWKKRARIVLGTGSVVACGAITARKIIKGEYDKNLMYSVAGVFAGLSCFRLGAYKNVIPSFLRTKKLKEELHNEFAIGGFIENDREIHADLKKYAPTKEQVEQKFDEIKNSKEAGDLIGAVKLISLSEGAVQDTNKILDLVESKYHSYMHNRTSLWGLAYAYVFKVQRSNPYDGYLNSFGCLLEQEKSIIDGLEANGYRDMYPCVSPDNFVKYIMAQKRIIQYSDDFWRVNKYLGKKYSERMAKMSPQPLTKFTEDGILLINNECITPGREAFYAKLITYGFDVQLTTPVLRSEINGPYYFDSNGKLKGISEDTQAVTEEELS